MIVISDFSRETDNLNFKLIKNRQLPRPFDDRVFLIGQGDRLKKIIKKRAYYAPTKYL
jgi:hypothetical protein